MRRPDHVAVLGIGHPLMNDDAIGVRVIRRLSESYALPERVRLYEGDSGAYRMLAEIDSIRDLLIVDAAKGNGKAGNCYRIDPEAVSLGEGIMKSSHAAGVPEILSLGRNLNKRLRATVIGIEAEDVDGAGSDLSPVLKKALPSYVRAVVAELRALGVRGIRKSRRA